jgi:hypothetical protein
MVRAIAARSVGRLDVLVIEIGLVHVAHTMPAIAHPMAFRSISDNAG